MSKTRLAQIFDITESFTPTKTAIYLKRGGSNPSVTFSLDSSGVSIDATNFSIITQNNNKLTFDDTGTTFTDSGFLLVKNGVVSPAVSDYAIVSYPVRASVVGNFFLALRAKTPGGTFTASVFIDDALVATLSEAAGGSDFEWFETEIIFGDTDSHTLGIRIEEDEAALDKIFIDDGSYLASEYFTISGDGPALTESPYVTVHLQIYEANNSSEPTTPFLIYDYKTTLNDIVADDWYNFDITPLISSGPLAPVISFVNLQSYAIVVSSSGESSKNFLIWELVDNDEYLALPSAVKYEND